MVQLTRKGLSKECSDHAVAMDHDPFLRLGMSARTSVEMISSLDHFSSRAAKGFNAAVTATYQIGILSCGGDIFWVHATVVL